MPAILKYGLQPGLMVGVLTLWYYYHESSWVYLFVVVFLQVLLGALEYRWPARPEWVHAPRYKGALVGVFILTYLFGLFFADPANAATVNAALSELRENLGLDIWPTQWPLVAQAVLALFCSEFIWYWLHRAEHASQWLWRLSAHGSHHAFQNLGAINAGANHPLEILLVLALPSAIVELLFGAGAAVGGSYLLLLTLAFLAHSNLDLNSKVIGWLFTTNRHHIHHHSVKIDESNTNFGCAVILWDRVFGTFQDAYTVQTGTGPTQPSLWNIFLMPLREPEDTQTAPRNNAAD